MRLEAIFAQEKKGMPAKQISAGVLSENLGLLEDYHRCGESGQFIMVDMEAFADAGLCSGPDSCPTGLAGNLLVSGVKAASLEPGTRILVGEAEIEITDRKKRCPEECKARVHGALCPIESGCVFARVVTGDEIHTGDEIKILGKR